MTRIQALGATVNSKGSVRSFNAPLKHAQRPEAFFGHRVHESSNIAFEMNLCHLAYGIGDHLLSSNGRHKDVSLVIRSCFNESLGPQVVKNGLHGSLRDSSGRRKSVLNLLDGPFFQPPDHTQYFRFGGT